MGISIDRELPFCVILRPGKEVTSAEDLEAATAAGVEGTDEDDEAPAVSRIPVETKWVSKIECEANSEVFDLQGIESFYSHIKTRKKPRYVPSI